MAVVMPAAVVVQAEDSPQLQEVAQALRSNAVASAQLILADGSSVIVPAVVAQALGHLVAYLAAGDDVTMTPIDRDYTIAEAAYLLGVSRHYLAQLVEEGEVPARLVDGRYSIATPDVLAHRAKIKALRAEGVRLIQQLSEEEGAYDG